MFKNTTLISRYAGCHPREAGEDSRLLKCNQRDIT